MARRNRKARFHRRKTRKGRKTRTSYPHGLKEAIGKWFPGQFFSHWPVIAGSKWSPLRLFWMAILMVWSAEQTLQTRFDATRQVLRSLFPKWPLGKSYTGWYAAQLKWLTPLRPALSKRLQQQIQTAAGRHWQREGWCAFAVDGSRVECPRTKANECKLKCAGRKKTGPQLFLTTLLHMGTGLPWDFRIGPGTDSERRHLEDMLPSLPRNALVVADAGFTGYDLYRRLSAAQQNFLIRVGANVHLLRKLGYVEHEGCDTVYLWPEKNGHEPPVVLRLIERRQGKKKMYLVTNVLDKKALTQKNAAVLYEMRWGVEVFYRSLKQTLQKRKMLSHSPEAAKCELTWTMYGMWLLGLLSVSKILARGGDPLRWSAAAARDRVRASLRLALTGRHQDRALVHDLGWVMKDAYVRRRSKKARQWPHKKTEAPPGDPNIQPANAKQRRAMQRLKAKQAAA
jgi:DDE family transposase